MSIDRIIKAKCQLIVNQPWYGHFAMHMNFSEDDPSNPKLHCPTMGVYLDSTGIIQCLYNLKYVESLDNEELIALLIHEIEHIVRLHCKRQSDRDSMLFNIACDMAINGSLERPKIGSKSLYEPGRTLHNGVWVPPGWPLDLTAEEYYRRIDPGQQSGSKKKSPSGSGQEPLDDHGLWGSTKLSEDEIRQVVKAVVDEVTTKAQGNVPAGLTDAIKKLQKPIVNWRQLLYQYIGRHVGNKRTTFSRRNRRRREFGIAGISHHAAGIITVVVDTSGSISSACLEQFFSEIDAISSKAKVFVLQWDHAFSGYTQYRRGDWKKLKIVGRGGTDMTAPMTWLEDNRKVTDVVIMLTDGYCNYKDHISYPAITVISDKDGAKPKYGHVVYIDKAS